MDGQVRVQTLLRKALIGILGAEYVRTSKQEVTSNWGQMLEVFLCGRGGKEWGRDQVTMISTLEAALSKSFGSHLASYE